jgi:hypothetical protein
MSDAEAPRSPRVVAIGRAVAGAAALAAWLALGLQLALLLREMAGEGVVAGLWRYVGFYTILTNLAVAVVASLMALRPSLAGPRLRLATATAIAFVGIVYSVALRALWHPTGWQAVSDHALHDVSPLLFVAAWLLSGHGSLRWRDALWTLAPPLAYCLYALARGAADGWYAYWFLNPRQMALPALATSIALLAVAALVLGLVMTAIDRWLGRSR